MKDYLKMSDIFDAACNVPAAMDDELYCGDHFIAEFCSRRIAINASHAINSHDELVEMNKELLEALEFAKSALEGSYDVNEWPGDGTSTCDKAISVADAAITKANGYAE